MAPPNPIPKFVYKIVPSAPPKSLPKEFPLSAVDHKDGFVHLSTAKQIPITAELFFEGNFEIWVIKLRLERFATDTLWAVEGCPHLYGNFGAEDAEGVKRFERDREQKWGEVMSTDSGFLE